MRLSGGLPNRAWKDSSAVSLARAAGRWQSPSMPAHYARAELAERGAVARFFYGK